MFSPEEFKRCIVEFRPEGFSFNKDYKGNVFLKTPSAQFAHLFTLMESHVNFELFKKVYYPLFLQRVIEGINKAGKEYTIIQHQDSIEAYHEDGQWSDFIIRGYGLESQYTPDQAKEQAIKYILEKI